MYDTIACSTKLKFQFKIGMLNAPAGPPRRPHALFPWSNILRTLCACVVNFYWTAFEILLASKSNEIQFVVLLVAVLLRLIRSPGVGAGLECRVGGRW